MRRLLKSLDFCVAVFPSAAEFLAPHVRPCARPRKDNPRTNLRKDDVLDNITLYWLTNTGISSGVSPTDPLQQGCEMRALCGLGTAEDLFRRSSRGLEIAACIAVQGMFAMPSAFDLNKIADSYLRVTFNHPQLSPKGPQASSAGL